MSTPEQQVIAELHKRAELSEAARKAASRTAHVAVASMSATMLIALGAIAVALWKLPIERYIYTDQAKAICDAQLEPEPLVTVNTVLDFAKDCVLDMDTFAHDSIERDLSRVANRCFTPGFRKVYFEAPWLDDRINTVREQFLRVSSETTGPVLVESEGPTAEGYRWTVQVPVKRTFRQGDAVKGKQDRVYRAEIFRVTKNAYNPVALGINKLDEKTR